MSQQPRSANKNELAKFLAGLFFSTFADRLTQIQLLSFVVLTGPDSQGAGTSPLFLLLPFILFALPGGFEGDKLDRKETLVLSAAGRALILLVAVPVFVKTGAIGLVIPSFLFSVCALIAIASANGTAILPSLCHRRPPTRLNAASLIVSTAATVTALSAFQMISDRFVATHTLTFCAAPYLVSGLFFWLLPREHDLSAKNSFKARLYLKSHKRTWSVIRLCLSASSVGSAYLTLFTLLVLQNIELNGVSTFSLFQALAAGTIMGALLASRLKAVKPLRLLFWVNSALTFLCLIMSSISQVEIVRYLFIVVGALSAMSIVASDSIADATLPRPILGRLFGLTLSVQALFLLPALLLINEAAVRFSAFTVLRIINLGGALLLIVVIVSSHYMRHIFVQSLLSFVWQRHRSGGTTAK